MSINNGGPAFPLPEGSETSAGSEGMTLRDYFAAHCPITVEEAADIASGIGMFSDEEERTLDRLIDFYASVRVKYADAMLAARKEAA